MTLPNFSPVIFCPPMTEQAQEKKALTLAKTLGLTLVAHAPKAVWYLKLKDNVLSCCQDNNSLCIDFLNASTQHRLKTLNRHDPLLKAFGSSLNDKASLLDGTAGLGQDALCLAKQGVKVTMIERSPYVHALLENGLQRSKDWLRDNNFRLTLIHSDTLAFLKQIPNSQYPDMIYLDPMYPSKQKSALSKLPMQCLQAMTEAQDDTALLAMARKKAKKRVVVKRPSRSQPLMTPDTSTHGKSHRFDIYFS